jgi:hypothetical protein
MTAMTEGKAPGEGYLAATGERRVQLARLYLQRLERILREGVSSRGALTGEEEQRLRRWAVLEAIRTLTALDEGPAASALLRAARRPQPAVAPDAPARKGRGRPEMNRRPGG